LESYGPNTVEVDGAIREVDNAIGELLEGLNERNLTKAVDLIILSDHGMSAISSSKVVRVSDMLGKDIINGNSVRNYNSGPTFDISFNNKSQISEVYDKLVAAFNENTDFQAGIQGIYTKENMPQRFHYTNSDRIADITILGKVGYSILRSSSSTVYGKY